MIIYQNPIAALLYVSDLIDETRLEMHNEQGELVWKKWAITPLLTIDTERLKEGEYVLSAHTITSYVVQRIKIKHV
jgi:hypothetical protein